MKNFRIPVMGLATCALLFTSCAKTITKQEAIDFVKANYTSTEPKTPTKMIGEFSGSGANDVSKDAVITTAKEYGFVLTRDKLSDRKEATDGLEQVYALKSEYIESMPEGAEFKLKGKELSAIYKTSIEVGGQKTSGVTTVSVTSEGYPNSMSEEASVKAEGYDYSYTYKVTYVY